MSIPEYFAGQTIFLTGATGSVGSVFLEKLLRACKGVRKVFLLIRTKNGIPPQERINAFLQLPVSIQLFFYFI
jgi:alcohol-forming fatty acyl-CoA reductase